MNRSLRTLILLVATTAFLGGSYLGMLTVRDQLFDRPDRQRSGITIVVDGEICPDLIAAHFAGSTGKSGENFDDYSQRLAKTLGQLDERERAEVLKN